LTSGLKRPHFRWRRTLRLSRSPSHQVRSPTRSLPSPTSWLPIWLT